MVEAVPAQQAAQGGGGNSRAGRVRPIPIGEDHLQFKHDPQIQGQLDHNGKYTIASQTDCERYSIKLLVLRAGL